MVYHTTPCRYLSDVSVALNAAAPVEEQLNQLFGIQTEEHKEYLAGHLKNKERVTALCHEHLGHQFPPPPSATNPCDCVTVTVWLGLCDCDCVTGTVCLRLCG